jgi:hypothetical protein
VALAVATLSLPSLSGLRFVSSAQRTVQPGGDLPSRLPDQAFWRISTDASEADGYFRSDNLTSNELWFQRVVPDLMNRVMSGGVYLGVGPEQNFTYMAAVRPAMAVIFDIRRGNMLVQLMYKALFELAADRVEFVSLLFSRPRPTGLGPSSSADELFAKFATVQSSEVFYEQNLKRIEYLLTRTHALPLSVKDLAGIEYVYNSFHQYGFAVRPWPTYAALMTETDGAGTNRSYLATEESFSVLKKLEAANLVVPVVGDFGGPKAIKTIAMYLKAHGATVSAFYLSNVEQYLFQDGKWTAFCRNVAALPLDSSSTFIRSSSRGGYGRFVSSLGNMASEVQTCRSF